jgi:hypothetical protein
MTDDCPIAAERAKPGEQRQWDLGHPGGVLSSASDSAIKRITAGVKARRRPSLGKSSDLLPGLHPPANQFRTKKEYCFQTSPGALLRTLAGFFARWPAFRAALATHG